MGPIPTQLTIRQIINLFWGKKLFQTSCFLEAEESKTEGTQLALMTR